MSCDVGHRCGSDPALLWLWCKLTALIEPLSWEHPYTAGASLKKERKKERKKEGKKKRKKESPEINLHTYGQLIHDKGSKNIQ